MSLIQSGSWANFKCCGSILFCHLLILWLVCRSPWSNKYDPPLEDGTVPSQGMRNLEVEANEVFSVYRDQ
jgi:hypothetical protein